MSIQELGSLGELIAAIATIATLAFLAVQIRNGAKADRTNAEIALPLNFSEWHARVSAQPEMQRIWDDAAIDPAQLTPEEVRRFRWVVSELFLVFESTYFAYRNGILSEPSWQIKLDTAVGMLQNPIVREWWENRFTPFSEEFRAHIDANRGDTAGVFEHQPVAPQTSESVETPGA